MAVYLLYGHKVLSFYLEEVLKSTEVCQLEDWPKVMAKDPNYYIFCHKQVSKETIFKEIEEGGMVPRTVIRRDLSLPVVMSTFRTNALQHAMFFHHFMN